MNIFRLHNNPMIAAEMHCDKHIPKMVLETAQMLSTAWRMTQEDEEYADEHGLYKAAYQSHPSTVWVCQRTKNYNWVLFLFKNLCKEYTKRYGKQHASGRLEKAFDTYPKGVLISECTKPRIVFPQCMPDQYKVQGNPVKAYRNYYKGEKAYFAKWDRGTPPPKWWQNAA